MKRIKFKKVVYDNKPSSRLMVVIFEVDGETLEWTPRWEDVREIFENAITTEFLNQKGVENSETQMFFESAIYARHLLKLNTVVQDDG